MKKNRLDFIQQHAHEMTFFQMMRLLEISVKNPEKVIQLASTNDLQFSPREIRQFKIQLTHNAVETITLTLAFLGVAGTQGALPIHYTELLLQHSHHHQTALVDFLNIFNHRSLTLFYKSWQKNHFYIGYEKATQNPEHPDLFTQMLQSLTGRGNPTLSQSVSTPLSVMLFHAGHYANSQRNAATLSQILSCYFDFPIRVLEWQGEWLSLSEDKCTTLNQNNRLGINTIAGKKIWSVQHKIRLRIGPLDKKDLAVFKPNEKTFKTLCNVTREFIGPILKFDIQLVVKSLTLSCLQLDKHQPSYLGWDTWIKSDAMPKEVHDIVLKEETSYE
jgi:type VI secretion system protein ImpH